MFNTNEEGCAHLKKPPGLCLVLDEDDVLSPAIDSGHGAAVWYWMQNVDGHRDLGVSSVCNYTTVTGLDRCVVLKSNARSKPELVPEEATIPIGFPVEGLCFLHAATWSVSGAYQVQYTAQVQPKRYRPVTRSASLSALLFCALWDTVSAVSDGGCEGLAAKRISAWQMQELARAGGDFPHGKGKPGGGPLGPPPRAS